MVEASGNISFVAIHSMGLHFYVISVVEKSLIGERVLYDSSTYKV
jgi:hypothetical protein